jgi:hypothetical protein
MIQENEYGGAGSLLAVRGLSQHRFHGHSNNCSIPAHAIQNWTDEISRRASAAHSVAVELIVITLSACSTIFDPYKVRRLSQNQMRYRSSNTICEITTCSYKLNQ